MTLRKVNKFLILAKMKLKYLPTATPAPCKKPGSEKKGKTKKFANTARPHPPPPRPSLKKQKPGYAPVVLQNKNFKGCSTSVISISELKLGLEQTLEENTTKPTWVNVSEINEPFTAVLMKLRHFW